MMWWAFLLAGTVSTSPFVAAETHRYAVLIGSNQGSVGEPTLKYAMQDANGVAAVLNELGGFESANTMVLANPTNNDVQATFEHVARLVHSDNAHGVNSLLVVYFSGHADATFLHLGGSLMSYREVLRLTDQAQATSRVVVVDACRSGEATLQKGVRRIAPFLMPQDEQNLPSGLAVLASASAGENAQESPKLHGSFFTHYLIAALRGAADFNADGKISLTEAFQYSADQTAASTADTLAGIQHATYRYQMHGRADLILTKPSAAKDVWRVSLAETGTYVFHENGPEGIVVLETRTLQPRQSVWLPAGHYYVQRRTPDTMWAGNVTVSGDSPLLVAGDALQPVEYARLASKGGGAEDLDTGATTLRSTAVSLWAGSGSPLLPGFAMPIGGAVQVSRTLGRLVLDGQLAYASDAAHQTHATIQMNQVTLLVGARWLFVNDDVWRLSAGLRAGSGVGRQSFIAPSGMTPKTQVTADAEAVLRVDFSLPEGFFLGVEGAADASAPNTASSLLRVTPRFALGLGYAF